MVKVLWTDIARDDLNPYLNISLKILTSTRKDLLKTSS